MSAIINSRKKIFKGRVFTLYTDEITLPNGVTTRIDILHHPGAAAMVPMIDDHTVLLIKQFRHALNGFIWEIPAGTLEENEDPLTCAKRELVEETGYAAETFRKLGELTPVPGYSTERIHLFLAQNLSLAEQNLDHDEMLDVHDIKFDRALEMIYNGAIQDAKTITGLFWAQKYLQ